MAKANILGRAWFIDDPEEIIELDLFEYELEPMTGGCQSGADWCREHLLECNDTAALREQLLVPPTGNYQVLFKGTMDGAKQGLEDEWYEWFELEESFHKPIPDTYLELLMLSREKKVE